MPSGFQSRPQPAAGQRHRSVFVLMMRTSFSPQTNTVLACRGSWSPSGTSQLNFLIESRPQESFFQAAAL